MLSSRKVFLFGSPWAVREKFVRKGHFQRLSFIQNSFVEIPKCSASFHSFGHIFFVLKLFLIHEVSIWRSWCALSTNEKMVDQFLTRLDHSSSQTWSNSVKYAYDHGSESFVMFGQFLDRSRFVRVASPHVACQCSRKSLESKLGYDNYFGMTRVELPPQHLWLWWALRYMWRFNIVDVEFIQIINYCIFIFI